MLRTLTFRQELPLDIKKSWDFFSNPSNLSLITPPSMRFKIISEKPLKIYSGLLIRYKIQPLPLYSTTWVTEIAQCKSPELFTDVQRKGPYKLWEHEHLFIEMESGTLMIDNLRYDVGYGFIGELIDRFIVYPKVMSIFDYRKNKLKELFQ